MFNHGKGGGGKGIWFRHNRIYLIPPYSSLIFLYAIFLLAADWQSIFYSPPPFFYSVSDDWYHRASSEKHVILPKSSTSPLPPPDD